MNVNEELSEAVHQYDLWHQEVAGEAGAAKLNAYFAAIAALGHLQLTYPTARDALITPNNQVAGIQRFVRQSMKRHDENRKLPSELGRTTRSTVDRAITFADRMNAIESLGDLEPADRNLIFRQIEDLVVQEIAKYLDQQAIRVPIDPGLPGPVIVSNILAAASILSYGGPVAQHLVGAKLAVRFPEENIDGHSYTAADQQTGRRGDFQIGSSVFHVTVGEQPGHFQKCLENLDNGLKPYLLVPEKRMNVVRTYFDDYHLTGRGSAQSIEVFVGQNMDELGQFETDGIRNSFAELLVEYNRRVIAAESNRGLLIEIPDNLTEVRRTQDSE